VAGDLLGVSALLIRALSGSEQGGQGGQGQADSEAAFGEKEAAETEAQRRADVHSVQGESQRRADEYAKMAGAVREIEAFAQEVQAPTSRYLPKPETLNPKP
jgi:hypothetical protein